MVCGACATGKIRKKDTSPREALQKGPKNDCAGSCIKLKGRRIILPDGAKGGASTCPK